MFVARELLLLLLLLRGKLRNRIAYEGAHKQRVGHFVPARARLAALAWQSRLTFLTQAGLFHLLSCFNLICLARTRKKCAQRRHGIRRFEMTTRLNEREGSAKSIVWSRCG